jgi:hypothetical protein
MSHNNPNNMIKYIYIYIYIKEREKGTHFLFKVKKSGQWAAIWKAGIGLT